MNSGAHSFEEDLSAVKTDVAVMRSNYVNRSDLQEARLELKEEIQSLRSELKAEIQALRSELRGEIQALRSELKGEIQALRSELKGDIQSVRLEVEGLRAEIHKALLVQTWRMYGFGVVLVTAVHFVTRAGY
jgi:chromosome segregation ATPase